MAECEVCETGYPLVTITFAPDDGAIKPEVAEIDSDELVQAAIARAKEARQ